MEESIEKDVPADFNILTAIFIPSIKNIGTKEKYPKAKFVFQGEKDKKGDL